jgi:hypothetical protein
LVCRSALTISLTVAKIEDQGNASALVINDEWSQVHRADDAAILAGAILCWVQISLQTTQRSTLAILSLALSAAHLSIVRLFQDQMRRNKQAGY